MGGAEFASARPSSASQLNNSTPPSPPPPSPNSSSASSGSPSSSATSTVAPSPWTRVSKPSPSLDKFTPWVVPSSSLLLPASSVLLLSSPSSTTLLSTSPVLLVVCAFSARLVQLFGFSVASLLLKKLFMDNVLFL